MNNRPECIPCCLRRVLHTADKATADDWLHRKILAEAMQELARVDEMATPAEVIHDLAKRAARTLGLADPYADERRQWIEETLACAAEIREAVRKASDPFHHALALSGAANVLDCELRGDWTKQVTVKGLLESAKEAKLAPDTVEELRAALREARKVLFVHDAAGELLFDRVLLEVIGKRRDQVVSVVRESPVLADATREDASLVSLGELATVLDPGIDCLGLPLNACSLELREHFKTADVVLAKGQACYETLEGKEARLDESPKALYFLLRVKCTLLSQQLGVPVGEIVLEAGA